MHTMLHNCLCSVLYSRSFFLHVAVKLDVLLRHGIAEYIWAKTLWYMLNRVLTVNFLLWIPTEIEVYCPYNNNIQPILKGECTLYITKYCSHVSAGFVSIGLLKIGVFNF